MVDRIRDADKFVYAWGMWERGRSDGITLATEMVEKFLCDDVRSAQQREVLLALYDSLLVEAKTRGWSTRPPAG